MGTLTLLLPFLLLDIMELCSTNSVSNEGKDVDLEKIIQMEMKRCTDLPWASCHYYKRNKICHVYKKSLYERCRKTCNLCGDRRCVLSQYGCCWDLRTPKQGPNGEGCPKDCRNIIGRDRCLFLKQNHACVTDEARMKKLCRGVCQCERYEMQFSPPKCMMSMFGCCWDSETEAKGPNQLGCPACKDRWPGTVCKIFWKDCKAKFRKRGVQMRKLCPERCGLCSKDTKEEKVLKISS